MLQEARYFPNSPIFLCSFLGFFLFQAVVSQIPLGSKLSVVDNNLWVSSHGDFALGFYNLSDFPNRFSVGIRFNSKSIPVNQRTIVWVAGADVTVSNNSYFMLKENGELVLVDSSLGITVWTSNTSQVSVASALLGDDGNLVLINEKKDVVWQSFNTPSDTLLPGQTFSAFKTLRPPSKNSVSNYYSLYMDVMGQLQLRWESSIIFWTSQSPAGSNLSAVLASDGRLQLLDQSSEPVWSVFGEDHNDIVKFRFLRIDFDGNLRIYSWREDSQSWKSVWQAVENQCDVFATCDQRGICTFNSSGSPVCQCPFNSHLESNPKCLAPYYQHCSSGSAMLEHRHMVLYGIYPSNDSIFQTSLEKCKEMCRENPSCTAVTFMNDGSAQCRMKLTRFISGYSYPSLSSISFVKTCLDPKAVDPIVPKNSSLSSRSYELCVSCLLGAVSGTFVIFVAIQFVIGFWIFKRREAIRKKIASAFTGANSKGLIIFSFNEIKDLTENFKHKIGPRVFRGMLPEKQLVAVKELEVMVEERKFRSAVLKVGNIHHKNLLKVDGYCCEFGHKYLVYEYAKNGSLEKYMEDSTLSKKLTWRKRIDICLSVARALCYLHTECREFISHGNLKCENVVLDENFEAKVSEFGLSSIHGEGSFCYADKDVKDVGKMMLILVTGCRRVEEIYEWTYREWIEGQAVSVVDSRIDGNVDVAELERVMRIAFWCLQADGRLRPGMGEVVKVLEGTLLVDPPPPPFLCHRSPPESPESCPEA